MTEAKLKELANAAGYEIKHGFTHSEEGSRISGQSGYEIINAYTGEAVTHSACGETWHFAYTLEEVEDFLKNVYEQSGVKWEPGISAREMEHSVTGNLTEKDLVTFVAKANDQIKHLEQITKRENDQIEHLKQVLRESNDTCTKAINMANALLSKFEQEQEENERIRKKAMELLPAELDLYDDKHPVDIDAEMKSCRELCSSVADAVRDAWKNEVTDVNEIRLKMTLIGWILDTNNFGDDPDSNNFYSENLLTLSHAMAQERVRQMEYDEFSRLRQEAAK